MDKTTSDKIIKHHSSKSQRVTNHVVQAGKGSVSLTNYLKTNDTHMNEENNYNSQDSYDYTPLPHQEMDAYTDSSDTSVSEDGKKEEHLKSNDVTPIKEQRYRKSPGLRKQFRVPLKKASTIITPQTKTVPSSLKVNTNTTFAETITSPNTLAKKPPHKTNLATEDSASRDNNIDSEGVNANNDNNNNVDDSISDAIKDTPFKENQFKETPKPKKDTVYHSPYLHKTFKPSMESLEIPPELESLASLLLLQHEALSRHIQDLGIINLNSTKTIDKKMNSFQLLKNNSKIPRSLRIRCT
jgi:hypothetical protein